MKGTIRSVVTVGVAAVAMSAGVVSTNAQVPGDNPRTSVYPVNDPSISIVVGDTHVGEDGQNYVTVTVQNTTGNNLNCTGMESGAPAATVTNAEVVAKSVDFYATFPESDVADLTMAISRVGNETVPLGSVQAQAGSIAPFINPEWGALEEIGDDFAAARRAGQYGVVGTQIQIPAQQATDFDVRLDQPLVGTLEEFQAAVFMTCVVGGQRYVFHGYEGGTAPAVGVSNGSGSAGSAGNGGSLGSAGDDGSLGSISTDSLGS